MRVEYLRAWEDGTWDTVTVDVPEAELVKRSDAGNDDWTLTAWAREYLSPRVEHRKVVAWAVYCVDPEERDVENRWIGPVGWQEG